MRVWPGLLLQGRFYYERDRLTANKDDLVLKEPEFLRWAERVYRRIKKILKFSPKLDAYLGPEAYEWSKAPGRLLERGLALTRLLGAPKSDRIQ